MIYIFNIKKLATISVAILIPIFAGFLSSLFSQDVIGYYNSLNKPILSPPGVVFPIIWTVLYTLMGISSYLVYTSESSYREDALKIYALQLAVNFLWSIAFFRINSTLLALIVILILFANVVYMIYLFNKVNRKAALLQIPYLIWTVFAVYLNLAIFIIN